MSHANGKNPATVAANISRIRQLRMREWENKAAVRLENVRSRQLRSPAEQLQILDWHLGTNVGAVRERARLKKLMKG